MQKIESNQTSWFQKLEEIYFQMLQQATTASAEKSLSKFVLLIFTMFQDTVYHFIAHRFYLWYKYVKITNRW